MKPQQQGFILNRSSGTSHEYESASDWEWWEQMITQASQQNKQQRQRYITTEERTLLDIQSSVIRAQYDITKHELLSNSSIGVVQNNDIKLWNNSKHRSKNPKRIKGHLKQHEASDKRSKEGTNMLNECCSYCNLTTAHVDQLNKGQRHRFDVARNLLDRTGCVELSSKSSAVPRHKVDKWKQGRTERLKAKLVHSDTVTNSLNNGLQTVMIKLRPEKTRLIKGSTIFDKMIFKSKKAVKQYQQNAEHTKLPIRQDHLENKAKCLVPAPHTPVSEKELNDSKCDSWYNFRQNHQEGNTLISFEEIALQPNYQEKAETPLEQYSRFLQLQEVHRPSDIARKYRHAEKPSRRNGKPRYSERNKRTEPRRRLKLNHAISVDSADNSTLREEYTNYIKNTVLRQAAEIKSSLALNVTCNKNNNKRLWEESPHQTQLHGVSEAKHEHPAKETRKKGYALKRCSCEFKLYSDQSETESMIINVLNPTNQSAASEILSSLFDSSDFDAKRQQRDKASPKANSNNLASLSVLRAMCKEAHTCLNIKEEEYVSASSNLLVKPAVANLHEACEKIKDENEMNSLKLEAASGKSYQSQGTAHLFDRSTKANDKIIQKSLRINDRQWTIRNVCEKQRDIYNNNTTSSVVNISSLSLLHSEQLRKLPRMEAAIGTDFKTSSNLFNLKNVSAVSFILSSVTITEHIRPTVCRRNRIIIPASTDISEYLETPKTQPLTDSVLKSSSKVSLFQSDSIFNFLMTQQAKDLVIRNSLNGISNTLPHPRDNNALVSLDSQLLKNIEITQSKETYEVQTLRKAPGKNALNKHVTQSPFSRSFCTMNLRIPVKDLTSPKLIRDINNYMKEEPILSVIYQKDTSPRPKDRLRTSHSQMNNICKVTRRPLRKELYRVIKPIQSQKHMGSNLKKVKFQKNDVARLSKYTTLEKVLVPKGYKARHKQESQAKLLKRDRIKSPGKRISSNLVPHEVARNENSLSYNNEFFKDITSWPTSYPITSGSKDRNYSEREDSSANNENNMSFSQSSNKLHQSRGDTDGENDVRFSAETGYLTSQAQLSDHKSELNKNNRLLELNSNTGANRSWKSVFNKCLKTIKSMTTRKTSIVVNTKMSASKCKQWEQSCYFCTVTPKINKLSVTLDKLSDGEYMEYKVNDSILKRCSGTLNFLKKIKVQDYSSKIKKKYNQKLNNRISTKFTDQTRVIYQNPVMCIYKTCDSSKYSMQSPKKKRPLGTRTDASNMSTVSMVTSHGHPFYKSKSTQSIAILKNQSKVPRNSESYKIETIYPLTCKKISGSKSEIILSRNSDIEGLKADETCTPNSCEGIQFDSERNEIRVLKKRKEKPILSQGSEHFIKPSLRSPTNFKRFLILCMKLLKLNNKTKSKVKAVEVKSKVNEFDSKYCHKEIKPSFKSPKLDDKHIKSQGDDLKNSKHKRRHKESDRLLHSEKLKNLKIAIECRRGRLDRTHLYEGSVQSQRNCAKYQSGDAGSFASKISNENLHRSHPTPSNCYRQDKLCCGFVQTQSNKFGKKSGAKLLRDSQHKKIELPRIHDLSGKIQSQKSVDFKKTNCKIIKKDVGINCIRKKRFKNKSKCVQAELCAEKTALQSWERKTDYTPECKTSERIIPARKKRESTEIKIKICGHMASGIKKNKALENLSEKNKNVKKGCKKEYVPMEPIEKNDIKISHTIPTKCKNFLKMNKPPTEQVFEEENPCYRYVDCNIRRNFQRKTIKHLGVDNANKFKCTQTPPEVKKSKSTKPDSIAKTAVKALQVDSKKRLDENCKINQIKLVVKPKEFTTLPCKSDRKKNEATVCDKAKQKNKYAKTLNDDPLSCCKTTSTDNLNGARATVKQKPAKNTVREKKSLLSSSVNRQNDISKFINGSMKTGVMRTVKTKHQKNTVSAIKALLLHKTVRTSDANDSQWCETTSATTKIGSKTKQKKEKTNVRAKKDKSSQKSIKVRNKDVLSVSTINTSKKLATKSLAKQKQKKNNAKTKTALSLNKAVMTQDILVSSCCTNTTPSIDKKNGTNISAKRKRKTNTAKVKKALSSKKAVQTKGDDNSARSTMTTLRCDKKVETEIYFKKKKDKKEEKSVISCPSRSTITTFSCDKKVESKIYTKKGRGENEEKRALSCPRATTRTSVKVKKEKPIGSRKQPRSDSSINKCGEPFIKGTQTKIKRKAKQINTRPEVRIPNKAKMEIYTTEDKQTSASSKCMVPLKTEPPVKYSTMMSANRTKQVCCALLTAGAWHNSKAAISRTNQVSASANKPLKKNLQVMTTHGVTCNMDKQRNSRKSKCMNTAAKEKVKESNIPLSKSSPCCICGNTICEQCKKKIFKKSTENGSKDKKWKKIKTKGEKVIEKNNDFMKPTVKQNAGLKVMRKGTVETIQRKVKDLVKGEKNMEILNKQKSTYSAKEAKKIEKINKQNNKRAAKEAKKMAKINNGKNKRIPKEEKKIEKINTKKDKSIPKEEKKVEKLNKGKNRSLFKEKKKVEKANKRKDKIIPKEKKKGKFLKIKYQSITKDRLQRKDVKESKRKNRNVQKQTKKSLKDARVKKIRVPFPFFSLLRVQENNQRDLECQQLYKTPFRERRVLFMYAKSCGYFLRSMLRRLLGFLFFALGVIIWSPGICCFECCRECLFCCCR